MRRAMMMCLLAAFLGSVSAQSPEPTKGSPNKAATPDTSQSDSSLYKVEDGDKVDQKTLDGWKTWRALACERCHGAEQEGLVGPALVDSMKRLSKEEFHTVLMQGRPDKGMPPFNTSAMVDKNWEGLYAYLKGRADGQIKPGRLAPLDKS